jgi:hypothetical protein
MKPMVFDFNNSSRLNLLISSERAYLELIEQIRTAMDNNVLKLVDKRHPGLGYGNSKLDKGNFGFLRFLSVTGVTWELIAPSFPSLGEIRNFEGPDQTSLYEARWDESSMKPYEFQGELK